MSGQQQTFRPFFDARFTSGLLDFRRKSDPFCQVGQEGGAGAGYDWSGYNNYSGIQSELSIGYCRYNY